MMEDDGIVTLIAYDFPVTVDTNRGLMSVEHDGTITWDRLQAIKALVWGDGVRAIEVYPAASDVVNNGNYRHLWRLGARDWCPDLLGYALVPMPDGDTLARREARAWSEAQKVFA